MASRHCCGECAICSLVISAPRFSSARRVCGLPTTMGAHAPGIPACYCSAGLYSEHRRTQEALLSLRLVWRRQDGERLSGSHRRRSRIASLRTSPATAMTGIAGSVPHHTEVEMPVGGLFMANGFEAGRTWIFDLRKPLQPHVAASFGDLDGYMHLHTFFRLPNGNLGNIPVPRWARSQS